MPGDGIMATMGGAGATRASCFGTSMAATCEMMCSVSSVLGCCCEDEGRTERECVYIVRV